MNEELKNLVEELLEDRCYVCRIYNPHHKDCNTCLDMEAYRDRLERATRHEESVCPACGGTGIGYDEHFTDYDGEPETIPCPPCHGTGRVKSRLEEIDEEEK